jgi:hypothetical protein
MTTTHIVSIIGAADLTLECIFDIISLFSLMNDISFKRYPFRVIKIYPKRMKLRIKAELK